MIDDSTHMISKLSKDMSKIQFSHPLNEGNFFPVYLRELMWTSNKEIKTKFFEKNKALCYEFGELLIIDVIKPN